jgi:hypothetical protein
MQRCPNCRARYHQGRECRRCGMLLEGLLQVEQAAQRHRVAALQALAAGDRRAAVASLERSRALCHDPLTEALLGFVRSQ